MTAGTQKPDFFGLYSDEAFQAQVEAGNITEEDISALNRLQSQTRLYRNIGLYGGAGAAAYYARFNRKPPWSFPKTALFSTVGAIGGMALSSVAVATALYSSFRGFKDNPRFRQAMEELREGKRVQLENQGVLKPSGIQSRSGDLDGWGGVRSAGQSNGSGDDGSTYSNPPESRINSDGSQSRWEDIRAANKTSRNSTWDKIREVRQKSEGQTQDADSGSNPNTNSTFSDPSRTVPMSSPPFTPAARNPAARQSTPTDGDDSEQTRFNALLEAERNFAKDQDKFIPDSAVDGAGSQRSRRG